MNVFGVWMVAQHHRLVRNTTQPWHKQRHKKASNTVAITTMNFDQIGNPKICAVVRGKSPATSLSYHEDGKHLYVASEQDSRLRLVDTLRGVSDRPCFKFQREGIRVARATWVSEFVECIFILLGFIILQCYFNFDSLAKFILLHLSIILFIKSRNNNMDYNSH